MKNEPEVSCHHSWKKQVSKRDAEQLLLERVAELEGTVFHTRHPSGLRRLSSGSLECSSAAPLLSSIAPPPRELKKLRAEKLSKHKAPNEKVACLEVAAGPAPGTVLFADPPNDALKMSIPGLPRAGHPHSIFALLPSH